MLQEGLAVLQQHPHQPGVELLQKQLIMIEMIMTMVMTMIVTEMMMVEMIMTAIMTEMIMKMIVIEMIMMMRNVCCRNAALLRNTKSF